MLDAMGLWGVCTVTTFKGVNKQKIQEESSQPGLVVLTGMTIKVDGVLVGTGSDGIRPSALHMRLNGNYNDRGTYVPCKVKYYTTLHIGCQIGRSIHPSSQPASHPFIHPFIHRHHHECCSRTLMGYTYVTYYSNKLTCA